MMSSKIDWKNRFVEFILITVGVLIAFGLNTCNENRKERHQTRLFLEGINEELIENSEDVEQKLPYHKELLETLRKNPQKANLILRPPNLNDVAWKLSENSTFREHVNHESYKMLAEIYQLHSLIEEYTYAASKQMIEVNIMFPYHALAADEDTFTEENMRLFEVAVKEGWIPVFETWTAMEEQYLNKVEEYFQSVE
jgi:uncharacterized membrane protein YgaE (UPF0421/DUF939 family)